MSNKTLGPEQFTREYFPMRKKIVKVAVKRRRTIIFAALASMFLVFCSSVSSIIISSAQAGSRSIALHVGTTVQSVTKINVLSQPGTFTVTKDDIKAGFVDVPTGGSYLVTNNDRAGYKLVFQTSLLAGEGLSSVTVTAGLANPVPLTTNGATYAPQPYKAFKTTLNLGVRIGFISKDDKNGKDKLKPGIYSWPILSVGVLPL